MSQNVSIIARGPRAVGSKVLVDGVPMKGVFKVELVADARVGSGSQLWTAVIHVHPGVIEVTDMDSDCVEFVRGKVDHPSPHLPEPMPSAPPERDPIKAAQIEEDREVEALSLLNAMCSTMQEMRNLMRAQGESTRRYVPAPAPQSQFIPPKPGVVPPQSPPRAPPEAIDITKLDSRAPSPDEPVPPDGWPDFEEATDDPPAAIQPDTIAVLQAGLDSLGRIQLEHFEKVFAFAERLAAQVDTLADWARECSKVIGVAADKVNGMAGESPSSAAPAPRGKAWDGRGRAFNGADEPCNCDNCVQAHRLLYPTGNCGDLACLVCVPDPR